LPGLDVGYEVIGRQESSTDMAREDRGFSGGPPAAVRMEFARRLQNAMSDKGWTQSELARRVAPYLPESRLGRDNISKYVRGKVLPLPPALAAMAKVLGVESKDLLPSRATQAVSDQLSPMDVRDIGGGRYWLQINQAVDADIALEIMSLLHRGRKKEGEGA
jgi:transcriptional regulator with XRE-family HTH domain